MTTARHTVGGGGSWLPTVHLEATGRRCSLELADGDQRRHVEAASGTARSRPEAWDGVGRRRGWRSPLAVVYGNTKC
jgi:hypothetical protein